MKRITKVVGFVAGIGAIVWMMRDRLVTLTVAREPEPPTFRVPDPPTPSSERDDLTGLKGIGPTYRDRLLEAGVTTFTALADADAADVAAAAGVSRSRASDWISQAADLA